VSCNAFGVKAWPGRINVSVTRVPLEAARGLGLRIGCAANAGQASASPRRDPAAAGPLPLTPPGPGLTPTTLGLADHARRLKDDAEQGAALFKHPILAGFALHTANNNFDEAAPLALQLAVHVEETLAASSDLDSTRCDFPSCLSLARRPCRSCTYRSCAYGRRLTTRHLPPPSSPISCFSLFADRAVQETGLPEQDLRLGRDPSTAEVEVLEEEMQAVRRQGRVI
jgi:hypothetical protein